MIFLFDYYVTFMATIRNAWKMVPARFLFIVLVTIINCIANYHFKIYADVVFVVLISADIILAFTFLDEKVRFINLHRICYASMGMMPILMLYYAPENEIFGLGVHYLVLIFMPIMADKSELLIFLGAANFIGWLGLHIWIQLNIDFLSSNKVFYYKLYNTI